MRENIYDSRGNLEILLLLLLSGGGQLHHHHSWRRRRSSNQADVYLGPRRRRGSSAFLAIGSELFNVRFHHPTGLFKLPSGNIPPPALTQREFHRPGRWVAREVGGAEGVRLCLPIPRPRGRERRVDRGQKAELTTVDKNTAALFGLQAVAGRAFSPLAPPPRPPPASSPPSVTALRPLCQGGSPQQPPSHNKTVSALSSAHSRSRRPLSIRHILFTSRSAGAMTLEAEEPRLFFFSFFFFPSLTRHRLLHRPWRERRSPSPFVKERK